MTNALPVRRMGLPVAAAAAPAAYVRAAGLAVERLEQTYVRAIDEAAGQRYDHAAPAFGFGCRWRRSGGSTIRPPATARAGISAASTARRSSTMTLASRNSRSHHATPSSNR